MHPHADRVPAGESDRSPLRHSQPGGDLLELLHQRLDLLGPDTEFFHERDGLSASELEPIPEPFLLRFAGLGVDEPIKVGDVLRHQEIERPEIVRHPREDLILLQILGE